jgi:AcrR family transcriptional regulator
MARKPEAGPPPPPEKSDRERIVEAFMALLAERPFEEIGFTEIAARAQVPLGRCRAAFDSKLAVIAAQMREIDRKVLEGGDADSAQEPPRERLFDVLMRRLEALAPHKAAVRSLARAARRDPALALALNGLTLRSQHWMLTAANISGGGLRGAVRAQGLACLYASVLRTWLNDDDPGMARTMAALDRELARAARWSRCLDDLCRVLPNPLRGRRWRPRERADEYPGEQPAG